jgi:hypothetical protein
VSTFVQDVLYETRVFAMHAQSLAEGAIFAALGHCYEWHAHRMDTAKSLLPGSCSTQEALSNAWWGTTGADNTQEGKASKQALVSPSCVTIHRIGVNKNVLRIIAM